MALTIALPTLRYVSLKGEQMRSTSNRAIVAFALIAAMGISVPAVAYASSAPSPKSTAPSANFVSTQQTLEAQLASRFTRLQHLDADVSGATTLSANVSSTLQARLSTEETSINSLIAKVPTDTNNVELSADRAAMYKDNRVYAAMSPQVFESIEASVVAGQVTGMLANESTLQSEVTSLTGLVGYNNALHHYDNYVARISNWSTRIVNVEAVVLAQIPQDFPGDTQTFVSENHHVLDANVALAYASYDASIIGLAAGGYTGS
jgi:hypothetical protein